MLRSFVIALAAIVGLAAAQPSEAAGGRSEARSTAGKASKPVNTRASARAPARPAVATVRSARARPASRAEARSRATSARTASARSGRQVVAQRSTGRNARGRAVVRTERQAELPTDRPALRMVGLFSSPAAAATLPARDARHGKGGKSARAERGQPRMGVWHAGLPAPDGEQMDCPTGTMAILARGHTDTFRCMPI
jgi:hypothetical protein